MPRKIPRYDDYELIGRVRTDANLALANSDPILIRRGLIDGGSIVHKFGHNADVPNGSWEGVLQATAQFTWLTAATTVRIKAGGNIADDGASSPLGAGAHEVTIQGLDINGAVVSEAVSTAGASASASTTTEFFRVFRAWVSAVGVYSGVNTANIIIENTAGTLDLIMIAAGEGQTQYCGYTIPAGEVGYLAAIIVHADAAKAASFRLFTRENADNVTPPYTSERIRFYWDGVMGLVTHQPVTPMLALPAWTDIWIEARGGGANTEVSADMEIIMFDV